MSGNERFMIYVFRTVSFIEDLESDVFIFGNLKSDFERFKERIRSVHPSYILGIGNAHVTQYESIALNQFHGKAIDKTGPSSYALSVPRTEIPVSMKGTNSFCNWTMYKVAQFLEQEGLDAELFFLHTARSDKDRVLDEIRKFST